MLNGDIDDEFTNQEFRSYLDASNPENLIEDLTQHIIHIAIERGVKDHVAK